MTKFASALANGGVAPEIKFVKRIVAPKGVVFECNNTPKRIYRQTTAFLLTDMLINVVNNGTARNLRKDYQIAAKTGTVGNKNGNTDAVIAGYTTDHTFVVWYRGQFDNTVCGSNAPCRLASKLLDCVYNENNPTDFEPPQGVVRLKVDKDSLEKHQKLLISQEGREYLFDVANKPTEKLEKTVYNHTIDVKNCADGVCLRLPYVPNGKWELYKQVDGTWQKVALDDCCFSYCSQNKCKFFAKLYVNNEFVYQTPQVEVCATCQEDTSKDNNQRNSLLDFWYW